MADDGGHSMERGVAGRGIAETRMSQVTRRALSSFYYGTTGVMAFLLPKCTPIMQVHSYYASAAGALLLRGDEMGRGGALERVRTSGASCLDLGLASFTTTPPSSRPLVLVKDTENEKQPTSNGD